MKYVRIIWEFFKGFFRNKFVEDLVSDIVAKAIKASKPKVEIYEILRYTPSGYHAWVLTSVGTIRKPTNKIPKDLYVWNI